MSEMNSDAQDSVNNEGFDPQANPDETGAAGATEPTDVENPESGESLELSELDTALLRVAEVEEQLARRTAELYNVRQEYNNYVKRSKLDAANAKAAGTQSVVDTLLSVLDDAALAREHGDLGGPAGTIVEKLENTLATNYQLERFGAAGDTFDPEIHEALMHQTSPEVTEMQVAQLIQPGYRMGEKVLRPARVGVVSPE